MKRAAIEKHVILEPTDYTFIAFAKEVDVYKEKRGVTVMLSGIDQDAFNSKGVIKRIDVDLIIETIGAEKLMNRILQLKGKSN